MGNSVGDVLYNAAVIHEAQRQRKKDEEDRAYELQKRKLAQDKYALDLADYQERKAEAQRRREKENTEWEWKKTDRELALKDLDEKKTAERTSTFLRPFTPSLGLNPDASARVLSGGVPMSPVAAAFGATMPGMSGAQVSKALQANMPDLAFSMEGVQTQKDRERAYANNQAIAHKKAEIAAGVRSVGRVGRGPSSGVAGGSGRPPVMSTPSGKYYDTFAKLPDDAKRQFDSTYSELEALAEKEGRDPPSLSAAREKFRRDYNIHIAAPPAPAPAPRPAADPTSPQDLARSADILSGILANRGRGGVPANVSPAPQPNVDVAPTVTITRPMVGARAGFAPHGDEPAPPALFGLISPPDPSSPEPGMTPPSAMKTMAYTTEQKNADAAVGNMVQLAQAALGRQANNDNIVALQELAADGELADLLKDYRGLKYAAMSPEEFIRRRLEGAIQAKWLRNGFESLGAPVVNAALNPIQTMQSAGNWATRKAQGLADWSADKANAFSRFVR